MALTEDTIFPLPDEVVAKGTGFALDIGGSLAKVFYRSKDDYEGGKPKASKKQSGVHMVNFLRDDVDRVIDLLKEKCDITKEESGESNVYTTGFGGSLYNKKISEALGVRLNNKAEFPLFVQGFRKMTQYLSEENIFLPLDEETFKECEKLIFLFADPIDPGVDMLGKEYMRIPEPYTLPENKDDYFPCLLVLAGSGNPFIQVFKDGSFKIVDFPVLGGRFLFGFSSMCLNVKTYEEMDDLIEKSEKGKTCDAFPPDLVPPPPPGATPKPDKVDAYSALSTEAMKEIATKFRIFPFGKATMPDFKGATKGDILYSMQRSVAEGISQAAFYASFMLKVKKVFFCGNFVSTPRVRGFITEHFHMQNLKTKPDERRNFRFIKNGGHLGAIGGYLYAE